VVTHLTTNPPVQCLSTAERTGSSVFIVLWSYVEYDGKWKTYDRGFWSRSISVLESITLRETAFLSTTELGILATGSALNMTPTGAPPSRSTSSQSPETHQDLVHGNPTQRTKHEVHHAINTIPQDTALLNHNERLSDITSTLLATQLPFFTTISATVFAPPSRSSP
jgi:hypothetical protein